MTKLKSIDVPAIMAATPTNLKNSLAFRKRISVLLSSVNAYLLAIPATMASARRIRVSPNTIGKPTRRISNNARTPSIDAQNLQDVPEILP